MKPGFTVEVVCEDRLKPHWGKRVSQAVSDAVQYALCMDYTSRNGAEEWCRIGMEILPGLCGLVPINRMLEATKGKPGIVVSAGPSLKRNIDELKEVQDRALIVAVTSALGPLQDAGVQPHIIVACESSMKGYDGVIDSPLWEGAYFTPGVHVATKMWSQPTRGLIPIIQSVGPVGKWLSVLYQLPVPATGGSVSTLAYVICRMWGCDPIILVGQDCAWGPDGTDYYAPGVRHVDRMQEAHDNLSKASRKVTAWGGIGQVVTMPLFEVFRLWFETRVRDQDAIARHINATEGGARIDGWEELRLDQVEFGEPFDAYALIQDAIDGADKLDAETLAEGLREQAKRSDKMCGISERGEAHARKLIESAEDFIQQSNDAVNVIDSFAVSPQGEVPLLPNKQNLSAMRGMFERTVQRDGELQQMIATAIKQIEESNAGNRAA
jgi:hypothetical protein